MIIHPSRCKVRKNISRGYKISHKIQAKNVREEIIKHKRQTLRGRKYLVETLQNWGKFCDCRNGLQTFLELSTTKTLSTLTNKTLRILQKVCAGESFVGDEIHNFRENRKWNL